MNHQLASTPALLVLALVSLLAAGGSGIGCRAFVVVHPTTTTSATRSSSSSLSALTERQVQFWEDVEEGLDDIENFYQKKGQSIDRIRQFGKRCVRVAAVCLSGWTTKLV
jgi:hypothetical protein